MSELDAEVTPEAVLSFWAEAGPEAWFRGGEAFDAEIVARFGKTAETAAAGDLDRWADGPEGALALIVVLDQFRRNIHRGTPYAFSADAKALALAETAVARGYDRQVPEDVRVFFYMPFEHAEDLAAQERCLELVGAMQNENYLKYARIHRDVIARFGRFPHRNATLGRTSTPEEEAYLADGGFAPS